MALDIEKLEKIIRLEMADQYQDRKVYRGLAAFIHNWTREAITKNPSPGEAALVEKVADNLTDYAQMSVLERAKAIQEVLDLTARQTALGKRNGTTATTATTPIANPVPTRPAISNPAPVASSAATKPAIWPEQRPNAVVRQTVRIVAPEAETPAPARRSAPANSAAVIDLDAKLTTVKGIGETYAKLMSFAGINTIHEALYYFPFRHEDFSSFKKINALMYGQTESVIAQVVETVTKRTFGGKEMIEVIVADETGRLSCIFFNRRMTYGLKTGSQVVLSGRVDEWNGRICFKAPSYEAADRELTSTGRLVPVYSTTGPLKLATLRKLLKTIVDRYAAYLPEHLPASIREKHHLVPLGQAVKDYHFPASVAVKEKARQRLAFDEFFLVQLGVLLKRHEWQEERPGIPFKINQTLLDAWKDALQFKVTTFDPVTKEPKEEIRKMELTGAQQKAIGDILGDIQKDRPMNRLLQGDVGSGKTVVGATALLMAVANGFQGALMAPTQILAEQHYQGLSRLFEKLENSPYFQKTGLKIRLELLTGNVRKKEAVYRRIREGEVDIVIGTSAVIEDVVEFNRLGLVIIDEQHRFGVRQRKALRGKGANSTANSEGANPHLLVMTATPIPRTLNLTVYGDLDLSLMNEMPPGREPIQTKWVMPNERNGAYKFIRKQVEAGRQAFVICPLVEESEKIEAKAAIEEHDRLQREVFPDLKLALLHGRMKPTEKDMVMHQFRDREYHVLVATSVIEVGIDIPNATVIMIEGADRFGLSQLHQFRGRVGRGQGKSYCLLLAGDELSQVGQERLKAIEGTNDGFELAEIDLQMRGPGEFFGTRQSGVPDLKVAGVNDVNILETARAEAIRLFEEDPGLKEVPHQLLSAKVARLWSLEGDLS
ncbi:MAG: ATP-dependent DNA helicase RecG [Chloroflexi bacterium]|nr:ATP-dependent DNA helicase RecG [Chloroflexota bacterium]